MEDICGNHYTGPNGIEWICIAPKDHPSAVLRVWNDKTVEVPGHYYVNRHQLESQEKLSLK